MESGVYLSQCMNCEFYEGVSEMNGCAPCLKHEKMVMSDNHCKDWVFYKNNETGNNQEIKSDAGKPRLTLVPTEIIKDIAYVREYGLKKYGNSESWKDVEIERYRDAMYRHLLEYLDDPQGCDAESGLPHLWHLACNVAFLCTKEREINDRYQ